MKNFIYLISGFLFAIGLSMAEMTVPSKVKAFLSIGYPEWSPALIFVLGSGVIVYFIFFIWIKKRAITLGGKAFPSPQPRPIDKKLLVGSAIFGVGWGVVGLCPGPALANLLTLDLGIATFLFSMFLGFELERRTS